MDSHNCDFDLVTEGVSGLAENDIMRAKQQSCVMPAGNGYCPDCGIGLVRLGACFSCPACGYGSCG